MTPDLLLALAGFAFVSSITPGPNNMMLLASGANFGFRASVPHMLGIGIGFVVLTLAAGAGLAQLFAQVPAAHTALKVVAALYMLWLAWRIATAAPPEGRKTGRPMTFLEAAAFQWVNPKAWAMALTAVTVYLPEPGLAGVLVVALTFGAINIPSVSTWTVLGGQMARLLTDSRRLRLFNGTMAVLLVLSLWPVLRA